MAWEGPAEFDGADSRPVRVWDCREQIREGPGVAEFEGVVGVKEVDGFRISVFVRVLAGSYFCG